MQCFISQRRETTLSFLKKNEHFEQNYIDYALHAGGVIVDIATGPGGGWVHGILELMPKDTVVISTDACTPCIHGYSEFYKDKNYYYFDVDLDKSLPFHDNSIDVFTGVLLCNVSNYRGLLSEVARCLKPGGRAVFHEIFFSPKSETYTYLTKENAVYASSDVYVEFCKSVGLDLAAMETCEKSLGKLDPEDGLPLSESDEWYRKNIYLQKRLADGMS